MYPELLEDLAVGERSNEELVNEFPAERVHFLYPLSHPRHPSLA